MIKYIKNDLFASDERVILHGTNCSGGFGSGFALGVLTLFPDVRETYLREYKNYKLGDIQIVCTHSNTTIVNGFTQQNYGNPFDGPYVSYPAVRSVIRKTLEAFPQGFAMPKVGAGLAGGSWDTIERIINQEVKNTEVRVYYMEDKV